MVNKNQIKKIEEKEEFLQKSLGLEGLVPEIFRKFFDCTSGYSTPESRIRTKGIKREPIAYFQDNPYEKNNINILLKERSAHYFHVLSSVFQGYDLIFGTKTKIMLENMEDRNQSENLIEEAKRSAYSLLDYLDDSLFYHRKTHTTDIVVPAAIAIAKAEGLTEEDLTLVGISAAFHDTGFVKRYVNNEAIGAAFAENFMLKEGYCEQVIQNVKDAIKNTDMQNPPTTTYSKILRDADLAIFGHIDFIYWNDALREEYRFHPQSPMCNVSKDTRRWMDSQHDFLLNHNWFTDGAKSLYEERKQRNIATFEDRYGI